MSPALADGFLTTVPPGKSLIGKSLGCNSFHLLSDLVTTGSVCVYFGTLSYQITFEIKVINLMAQDKVYVTNIFLKPFYRV